nr:hypothetical protein [Cyanobium sp. AMD-g]
MNSQKKPVEPILAITPVDIESGKDRECGPAARHDRRGVNDVSCQEKTKQAIGFDHLLLKWLQKIKSLLTLINPYFLTMTIDLPPLAKHQRHFRMAVKHYKPLFDELRGEQIICTWITPEVTPRFLHQESECLTNSTIGRPPKSTNT